MVKGEKKEKKNGGEEKAGRWEEREEISREGASSRPTWSTGRASLETLKRTEARGFANWVGWGKKSPGFQLNVTHGQHIPRVSFCPLLFRKTPISQPRARLITRQSFETLLVLWKRSAQNDPVGWNIAWNGVKSTAAISSMGKIDLRLTGA